MTAPPRQPSQRLLSRSLMFTSYKAADAVLDQAYDLADVNGQP